MSRDGERAGAAFDLDAAWSKIQGIEPPGPMSDPPEPTADQIEMSPKIASYRRQRWYWAAAGVAMSGVLVTLLANGWRAVSLYVFVTSVAGIIAAFFRRGPPIALLAEFDDRRRAAERRWAEASSRWPIDADDTPFRQKLDELRQACARLTAARDGKAGNGHMDDAEREVLERIIAAGPKELKRLRKRILGARTRLGNEIAAARLEIVTAVSNMQALHGN